MPYTENDTLVKWLEQETPETVLEPELSIIDPHHHLWDIRKNQFRIVRHRKKGA